MILSGSAPFTLRENRVSYLIPGGEMIDAFYGHPVRENCMQSQAWIASTTYSALGGTIAAGLICPRNMETRP